jgi:RNA polymerase sigma factor (sigma-70 family)
LRHRNIPALARQLAETGPLETDADLLGRFAARRDEDAFAALVRRHGRLVWAVCHHLAGPNADDAFQATFLVLLRNAGRVRRPDSLSAWLHGVAYRVCTKARLSARRRAARERAAAVPDRGSAAVPDSAWDRALGVVHEEVARLPEALRVPFVLCTLDGRSVTEAAGHLGWKVKTLSARLVRARDLLLARLRARGLAAGAAVALSWPGGPAPAAASAKAASLVRGGAIPGAIQHLTQGVLGMSTYRVKLIAAGLVLAAGLGVGGGAGWLAPAGAQSRPNLYPRLTPEERVKQLEAELEQAKKDAERAREQRRAGAYATAKWQYEFVSAGDVDAEGFVKALQEREAGGWEFNGQVTLKKDGRSSAVWVFRRPVGGGSRYGSVDWSNSPDTKGEKK